MGSGATSGLMVTRSIRGGFDHEGAASKGADLGAGG
jgi:hypothetical protein